MQNRLLNLITHPCTKDFALSFA